MNDLDQLNVQHDRIVYILPLTWVPQQNNAAFLYTYGVVSRLYDHGLDEGGVSSPKSDDETSLRLAHWFITSAWYLAVAI